MEAWVWLGLPARYELEAANPALRQKIERESKPLEEVM
jgi:hypothetical protein